MIRSFVSLIIVFVFTCTAFLFYGIRIPSSKNSSNPPARFSHTQFDAVLRQVVSERGQVNYQLLLQRESALDQYLGQIAAVSPETHPSLFADQNSRMVYWINAYNAFVLKGVLRYYPTSGVLETLPLHGFFWALRFNAGGEYMSLYHLENGILRKRFNEPRIHFAINCASAGCPALAPYAFVAEKLDQQLKMGTEAFIKDELNVRFDEASGIAYLSKIFSWYQEDFQTEPVAGRQTPLAYIIPFLNVEQRRKFSLRQNWEIQYLGYDWRLNQTHFEQE